MELKRDWLELKNQSDYTVGEVGATNCVQTNLTSPYPAWTYTVSTKVKIRLTLSEVDRLRKAAKDDEKLKAILSKFTPSIEVIVDFQ
jgi:hypothetical protein